MTLDTQFKQLVGKKLESDNNKSHSEPMTWDIFDKSKKVNCIDIAVYALINSSSMNKTLASVEYEGFSYFMFPIVYEKNGSWIMRYLGPANVVNGCQFHKGLEPVEAAKTEVNDINILPMSSGSKTTVDELANMNKVVMIADVNQCVTTLQECQNTDISQEELIAKIFKNPAYESSVKAMTQQQVGQVEAVQDTADGTLPDTSSTNYESYLKMMQTDIG